MALPVVIPNTFANANASIPLSQLDNNFSTVAVAINGMANGAEALSNVNITGGSIANASLSNVSISSGNVTINVANVTTLDATNVEVTNIKAKDGTASATIADSTGVMTIASSVLTTADINGGTIDNAAIGATTPTTGAFTTVSASTSVTTPSVTNAGTLALSATGANVTTFSTNGSERMRIDSSGNLGLGVTPSAWVGTGNQRAIQISTVGSISSLSNAIGNQQLNFGRNVYDFYGSKYLTSDTASAFRMLGDNSFAWFTAPSGTAGNTISFTQAMTLDGSGNLGIGTSSPTSRLHVSNSTASTNAIAQFTNGTTGTGAGNGLYVGIDTSNEATVYNFYNSALKFGTNGTERARIDSSGNLGIGVTPPTTTSGSYIWNRGGCTISDGPGGAYYIGVQNAAYNSGWKYVANGYAAYLVTSGGEYQWFTAPYGTAGNAISFTQEMTLDASGNLLVGCTTAGATTGITLYGSGVARFLCNGTAAKNTVSNAFTNSNSNNTDLIEFSCGQYQRTCMYVLNTGASAGSTVSHVVFQYGTTPTTAGSITSVGTTVTYGSASDVRLKNDLGVCKTSRIADVVIHDYEWKATGVKARGAFAQELYEIAPEAVVVGTDEVNDAGELKMPWQIDYSKLVPDLIAEIQSLRARVAQLESKGN